MNHDRTLRDSTTGSATRARRAPRVPRGACAWPSSAAAAASALLPHVLHHAGPLAGAALFAGVGGSLLFGALGLLAAVPLLVRMKRRCGSWRRPLAALGLFAAVFLISTFVVGPALTGEDDSDVAKPDAAPTGQPAAPSGHDQHH